MCVGERVGTSMSSNWSGRSRHRLCLVGEVTLCRPTNPEPSEEGTSTLKKGTVSLNYKPTFEARMFWEKLRRLCYQSEVDP